MGTQMVKLNEIANRIFEVKNIPKMFKNHAEKSPYGRMGLSHPYFGQVWG
jgi:hypothetical protein